MRKRPHPKVLELFDNQMVTYRLGRAGRYDVDWSEWKTGPLFVKQGVIVPRNESTADFGLEDFHVEGTSLMGVVEDYYLEIKLQ